MQSVDRRMGLRIARTDRTSGYLLPGKPWMMDGINIHILCHCRYAEDKRLQAVCYGESRYQQDGTRNITRYPTYRSDKLQICICRSKIS